MKIYRNEQDILKNHKGGSIAIGNFDGVHKGHQVVIEAAKTRSTLAGLPLAVVTFSPHPRQYFRPSDVPFLLQTKTSKTACLAALGVEIIIHINFNFYY